MVLGRLVNPVDSPINFDRNIDFWLVSFEHRRNIYLFNMYVLNMPKHTKRLDSKKGRERKKSNEVSRWNRHWSVKDDESAQLKTAHRTLYSSNTMHPCQDYDIKLFGSRPPNELLVRLDVFVMNLMLFPNYVRRTELFSMLNTSGGYEIILGSTEIFRRFDFHLQTVITSCRVM